ncbi:MAG: VOC family protein [Clostridia bacterium]|nr:VOC family protein [Clostridia bacterium]
MILGIEHVAIAARDTKALTDWYVKMFGVSVVYDNGKGTYFVKAPDGAMIEIIQADTEVAPTPTKDWGIRHFALSVSDAGFDELVAKLREENVEVVTEVSVSSKGIKTFFFRDPEGNIFHLIYRPEAL